MKASVFGASGFIGRHLVEALRRQGHEVHTPNRYAATPTKKPLGHVFYCIGLTAEFRSKPFETIRAHVSFLAELLEQADFESLLYLSSTRVYGKSATAEEIARLAVEPEDPSDLYNLSKLTGESLCFQSGRKCVRVARLSNVVGSNPESSTFLSSVVRDAVNGHITLKTDPLSTKDYVLVSDVCDVLIKIAFQGRQSIYNVASGVDLTHKLLLDRLCALTGSSFDVEQGVPLARFPKIDIRRIKDEFDFCAGSVVAYLPEMLVAARAWQNAPLRHPHR